MATGRRRFVEVAVDVPLRSTFHYIWGAPLGEIPAPGARLAVPFGRSRRVGYLLREVEESEALKAAGDRELKDVAYVIDPESLFTPGVLELARWISRHYFAGLGEVLSAALPGGVRKGRRARKPLPVVSPGPRQQQETFTLTRAQEEALEKIRNLRGSARRGEGPFGMLLEGVTGSGKTEVYLRAIAEAIAEGEQAIVLVPEIALTEQTIARFAERFERIAVLHSGMSEGARAEEWRRIRSGSADVVIGARSAVFAPVQKLGLIVVDEEHEPSYKQEASPRYNARDAALERARIERAVAVLGSATPSLESYVAARSDGSTEAVGVRLAHAVLPERIGSRPLPPVEIVDMRAERLEVKGFPVLSRRLRSALEECLKRHEQAIIFLNRRGYSTFLHCPRCGADAKCDRCDVPLVLHGPARGGELRCHYCGSTSARPGTCPYCGFDKLLALGTGTERVEEAILEAAPSARVLRMDSDTMAHRSDYERALEDFRSGRADVLVGTQMIAKGLDFPRVTLVGVVNADLPLNLPDFRASERAFQLIAQVAGRTGRGESGGRVIVQTALPESLAIRAGSRHDMAAFAAEELQHRRLFGYPPYSRLARIVVEGPRVDAVEKKVCAIADALRPKTPGEGWNLLGPAEAPLGRLRGRKRQHIIIKAARTELLEELLWNSQGALQSSGSVRVIVDVDPVNMR